MTSPPELPTEHACPNCGLGVAADAAFCPHCAAPTGLAPTPPAATGNAIVQVPTPQPPAPSGPAPGAPPQTGFATPPAGTPWTPGYPPVAPPQGPPGYVPGAPANERMSNGMILTIGVAAILIAVGVAYLVTSGGSDEEATDDEPPSETILFETTVEEAPLSAGSPVQVTIDADTRDEPRIHPLALGTGDTGTVVVSANQPFNAVVALVDPDGTEVPTQGVALGRRGAAVAVNAPATGDYEIVVSGFPPSLAGYTATFRPGEAFVTPAQTAVGDCVNRLEGEEWRNVNGFFVVSCDQPHEGQVFEQLPGVTDSGQAAHDRCDTARNNRVLVPGFVAWQAYWGAGLTCVLRSADGGLLTGSLVST